MTSTSVLVMLTVQALTMLLMMYSMRGQHRRLLVLERVVLGRKPPS